MKQQISPKIFFSILAVILLVVGIVLYRQATDPIYHNEPDEEDAQSQFSKGPSPSLSNPDPKEGTPKKGIKAKPPGKDGTAPQGATLVKPEAGNKSEEPAPAGASSKSN